MSAGGEAPKEPPEALVSALAWCSLHDVELVPILEALWERAKAGSSAATTAMTLLVIGWESGRAFQASAQRGARESGPKV